MTTRVGTLAALAVVLADPDPSYRTAALSHPGPADAALVSVSGDGRFVAFESLAQLVPADSNLVSDVYVLHVPSGRIELASVSHDGSAANGSSSNPRVSHDGRLLVFESVASNLVRNMPNEQPACATLFLRDRRAGTTRPISRAFSDPSRLVCAGQSAISSDGRMIAFDSNAVELVAGEDANGSGSDVYLVDLTTATTHRVSVDSAGVQHSEGSSYGVSISSGGRHVAFTSTACLDRPVAPVARAGLCQPQVYVRDRIEAVTRPVLSMDDGWPNGSTHSAALSVDGRYVAFASAATNLVRSDTGRTEQVYVYDLERGSIELVSRTPHGRPGNGASSMPVVAGAGRFVAFQSLASNLVCAGRCSPDDRDYNLVSDIFVMDRKNTRVTRLSHGPAGRPWWVPSIGPAIDGDGRVVAFSSRHPTGPEDVKADFDLFVISR